MIRICFRYFIFLVNKSGHRWRFFFKKIGPKQEQQHFNYRNDLLVDTSVCHLRELNRPGAKRDDCVSKFKLPNMKTRKGTDTDKSCWRAEKSSSLHPNSRKLYHITWLTFCHAQNTVKLFMLVFTFSHIFGLRGLTRLFRIYQWWNANYFLCYDWLLMITWSRFHLIWNSVVGFGIFPANSLVCVTTTNVRFLDGVHVLLCGNSS